MHGYESATSAWQYSAACRLALVGDSPWCSSAELTAALNT